MALHEYKIGTTTGNMVYVEQLTASDSAPPGGSVVKPYSVYRVAASGLEYGDGYPECEWKFPDCRPTHYNALMAYVGAGNQSASVYIKTRKDDTTFATYKAVMHRPKLGDEAAWALGYYADVTIRFTMLELQV